MGAGFDNPFNGYIWRMCAHDGALYVGTFDAPGIAILVAHNVSKTVATGYTLVLHVALWLPITLLGLLFMLLEHIGWGDFGRAVEERSLEISSGD